MSKWSAGVLPDVQSRTAAAALLAGLDPSCCPDAGDGVSSRVQTLNRRAARLADLDRIATRVWRWSFLAEQAHTASTVGRRLNGVAAAHRAPQIDFTRMISLATVAHVRRRSDLAA